MERVHTFKFFRRNLPHWLVADHAYFVTIRLKNTLPKTVAEAMLREREQISLTDRSGDLLTSLQRKHFLKVEQILDSCDADNRWLDHPDIADALIQNLEWLRSRGWIIFAATVLSTHMHLLIRNLTGISAALLDDLKQYKNFTARTANRVLGRTGTFWAREDFDHWIRSPAKFESTVRYIANNPVKAGRVSSWSEWKWTVVDETVFYCLNKGESTS